MTGIVAGSVLIVDDEPPRDAPVLDTDPVPEVVIVAAVSPTQFQVVLTNDHASGRPIFFERGFIARCDVAGAATQITPDLEMNGRWVTLLAHSRTAPDVAFAVTAIGRGQDQRLFVTRSLATADATTNWTEIAVGRPPDPQIASIAVHPSGRAFVMLLAPVTTTPTGAATITSPLFEIVGDEWMHQECENLPTSMNVFGTPFPFGALVADPRGSGTTGRPTLYATSGPRAFRLQHEMIFAPTPRLRRLALDRYQRRPPRGADLRLLVRHDRAIRAAPAGPARRRTAWCVGARP